MRLDQKFALDEEPLLFPDFSCRKKGREEEKEKEEDQKKKNTKLTRVQ